jgi:hypothetical protein
MDSGYIPEPTLYNTSHSKRVRSGLLKEEPYVLPLHADSEGPTGELLRQTSDHVLLCVLLELRPRRRQSPARRIDMFQARKQGS